MTITHQNPLMGIVRAQKENKAKGIYSVCSYNRFVIKACLKKELQTGEYVLIESTSNQVNQFGGYTGMNPAQFAEHVEKIAADVGFPQERIILGGDHLGPNVWRAEPVEQAMKKSCDLAVSSIKAGYSKIHLDASMKCADDDPSEPLDIHLSAKRAAQICKAAEDAYKSVDSSICEPCYIIGTEVPIPGGAFSGEEEVHVTHPDDAKQTVDATRDAFFEQGLESAWERVIGLVVQPGVEFGDSSLLTYDRKKASSLSKFIEKNDNLIFEAHSTDYQLPDSLKEMVEDHFAILKVGPALTFKFREAVFALEMIEKEWLKGKEDVKLSNVQEILEKIMLRYPQYWEKYYEGDEVYLRFARKYSYSDRSRYYWPYDEVQNSLKRLIENLSNYQIPENLLSQYLPCQYQKVKENDLANNPLDLIYNKIQSTISDYAYACQREIQ